MNLSNVIIGAEGTSSVNGCTEDSIPSRFSKIAALAPNAPAVELGQRKSSSAITLSYGELSARSHSLAAALIARGIKPGGRIALATDRNFDLVVGMLAILRAGASYVPINLDYPIERQKFILQDTGIAYAVTSIGLGQELSCLGVSVVEIDDLGATENASLPDVDPKSAAYVMYTSGSTGTPKGVVTPHSAVCHLVVDKDYTKFDSSRRFLQLSSVSFDAATFEIWGALLNGGCCVIYPSHGLPDLNDLRLVLENSNVNTLWLTSSLFNSVIDADPAILSNIDELLVGGEALSVDHIRKAQRMIPAQLINGYGPTETTTFACAYRIPSPLPSEINSIPIGKPIHGGGLRILDEELNPVSEGTIGELFIAGPGVGIGYLNQPTLTAEKFVSLDGKRSYRTGDQVRTRTDGNIEFIGRGDDQVKVSGHRIELGEIEHLLCGHPDIANAAATVIGSKGSPDRIAAWVVASKGCEKTNSAALRSFVEQKFPAYMRPSFYTFVNSLPLTPSGKLDRRALADLRIDRPDLNHEYIAPRGNLEAEIAAIWQQVIGIDRVGRSDRFFDLGGTSLMALQVLEKLRRQMGYSLSVAEFFDGPTVEKIAAAIQQPSPADHTASTASSRPATANDRIAIIGIGGRFAGAPDVSQFWDMLVEGRSGRVEVTREDLLAAGENPDNLNDPDYVAAAFPLDDAEGFDARFFGFSPREVQIMDPQQRIFLETAWATLENAGHDPHQSAERIGVFGGIGRNAYLLNNLMSHPHLRETAAEYNMLIGNERDFPATHVAFRLGLRGPAVTIQTACSTSGVAIHMAAESLRRGECDIALAGGAKVLVPNRAGYYWTEGGPLSSDGYLRAFDAQATGMVRGSGCAMVALKRLDDALEDGDHVYGVIIGSAINNDGGMKAGFTAPSVSGQAEAISKAYSAADIRADSISMIEAHGTGTVLGDPIEFAGLTRAFGDSGGELNSCAIGSVKTNIGHLDAGATAAGLIKAVLSLEHETIPPSLNFETPNPNIDFQNSPMFVPTTATPWRRGEKPRRAGISSFGLGGTNVHLVIEEAPEISPGSTAVGPELLVLSARTESALAQKAQDLAEWLEENSDCSFADVAHTLRLGRRRFEKRLAYVALDQKDAARKLRNSQPGDRLFTALTAEEPPVVFLFPGGGAQYAKMARGLYDTNAAFRDTIETCSAHFQSRTGKSLTEVMFDTDEPIEQPSVALPALLAVEIAMGRLWQSWGVAPKAMIGHSMGEYAAACLAGVFSLEDAMDIVICRGRLFETLEPGSMLSVQRDANEIRDFIGQGLSIAAVNRPGSCVVSGPTSDIETLMQTLSDLNIESRRVHINVAAHSQMVEPILDEFRAVFEGISLNPPQVPFVSNVSGDLITDAEATDPDYWVRHLRSTVEFSKGLSTLFNEPDAIFLEVGPGQTLASFARQHSERGEGHEVIATIRHPQEEIDDTKFLLSAVGKYWRAGGEIDWNAYAPVGSRRVPLPGYPFERVRHWIDPIPYGSSDAVTIDHVAEIAQSQETELTEAAEPKSRLDLISAQLLQIISRLSGLSAKQIDPDATFLELGFDSLFLTQANAAFKKAFKVPLTTRQLLETTPRLSSLADYLDDVLDDDIEVTPSSMDEPTSAGSASAEALAKSHQPAQSPGIASVTRTSVQDLTPAQDAHIDELIAQTVARTPKAKAATQASRAVLADPRTVQGFRLRWKEMVYPILSDRAKGSKVWDIDGNEYIDLVGGYGVTFLGHQSDVVVEAIKEQVDKTLAIGPQSVLAGEVAELVSQLTGMERVAFCNTGSEAVLAAVRMARTVTGKSKIAKFDGHYHGIFDEMQVRGTGQGSRNVTLPSAPGIPHEAVQNTVILDYGNPDAFDVIREQADDLALVLVEPVRSRNPDFQPRQYLQELRKVTEELGIPLMFDEIVTGFRSHPGGAQHLFGVRADLATYGKVVGGGLPIGIVTGSATYMDTLDGGMWNFGDDSVPPADMTWFAGTFVRHPMALASTRATLEHLVAQGPALQQDLNARSEKLASDLNELMNRMQAPIRVEQFSSVLRISFTTFQQYEDLLFFHLRNRGIMTYAGRPIFLTTAHSDEDLQKVYDAFAESVRTLVGAGLLEGRDPTTARRIPMATGQQEIWVSAQFSEDASRSYNLCSTLRLKGTFCRDTMQHALNDLADRHEALRSLPERDGLMQVIQAQIEVPLEFDDLSALDPDTRASELEKLRQKQVRVEFDLRAGPLVRAQIIRMEENDHIILLTVHHVIADGWSCGVLLRELGELYAARRDNQPGNLPKAQQLSDFVNFQQHPDQIVSRAASRDYWLSLHDDGLQRIDFPSDRPRPTQRDYNADRTTIALDSDLTQSLRKAAKDQNTTLFAALMGGFAAYVTRLTGAEENTIGFSAAGQPLLGGGSLVGHCVSFLPLKLSTDLNAGFGAHLTSIGNSILDALDHQNFDFVSFVQDVQPERSGEFAPLITVGLNLDPSSKAVEFADFDVEAGSVGRAYENLDLFLNFVEFDQDLELQCTFNTALFDTETIVQRMTEYLKFLKQGALDPSLAMASIDFFSPQVPGEQLAFLPENSGFERDISIIDTFRRVRAQYPERVAVRVAGSGGDTSLSYAQLDDQSDFLVARLIGAKVGKGDTIAVLLPRSVDFVIAILAILKCGAVYVPLNVDAPDVNLTTLIEDSEARIVLTRSDVVSNQIENSFETVQLDQISAEPPTVLPTLPQRVGPDPAYIMYTSGSTGQPKGVVVPHRAVTSLVYSATFAHLDETSTIAFLAPPSFDASTFEIWGALLNGGTLAVIPGTMVPQISNLKGLLEDAEVTTLWLTAALFNTVMDQDPRLPGCIKEILTGGEALSVSHVKTAQLHNPDVTIVNGYGPTECTTFTCCYRVSPDFDAASLSVPIGYPVFGRTVKIVDEHLRRLPPGVPGELVVGGDGLALGYWKRAELTDATFVSDFADSREPDDRLYRTGDICRSLPDGTIEFIGRRDDQVKIRGFRIEPAEIEASLKSIPGIENAAVVVTGDGQDRRLFAFCVKTDDTLTKAQVTEQLRHILPRHLVPSSIQFLEKFPATLNGKLDRKTLISQAEMELPKASAAQPTTETERQLVNIWSSILREPVTCVNVSFFDLGGHSLLALKLFDRLAKEFDQDFPISTLFTYPSVRDLAELIDDNKNSAPLAAKDATEDEPWDTSTVIHSGPRKPQKPFFIVGGAGGNVNNLVDLGQAIGRARPVIGFQSRGILGHKPRQTLEQVASEHIHYMRQHQPVGPYVLAGYSAGAQTAYEMARQLTLAGQEVSALFLIDTFAPGFTASLGTDDPFAMPVKIGPTERVADEISLLNEFGLNYLGKRVRSKLVSLFFRGGMVKLAEKVSPTFARSRRTSLALFEAASNYKAVPYEGSADLIFSKPFGLREKRLVKQHPNLGWEALIDHEKLKVTRLETTHFEMVRGEFAVTIAALVEKRLHHDAIWIRDAKIQHDDGEIAAHTCCRKVDADIAPSRTLPRSGQNDITEGQESA